jgi:hypothetical protein
MPAPRPYDASSRRESAARNRAAVLAACRELLFRDGYHRMTVRSVAGQAGVSPETIYKTFGGKPGLVPDDPNTRELRRSLRAHLETRNAKAAASQLVIARNTVAYRLRRAEGCASMNVSWNCGWLCCSSTSWGVESADGSGAVVAVTWRLSGWAPARGWRA